MWCVCVCGTDSTLFLVSTFFQLVCGAVTVGGYQKRKVHSIHFP